MDENLKIPSEILEPMILAYSRLNTPFFLKVKNYLDTNNYINKSYFNDEKYQKLFNIISKFFELKRHFPKQNSIKYIIDKTEKDSEIKLLLNSMVNKMFESTVDDIDTDMIEEEVIEFIKEAKAYEAIMESQNDIESKNFAGMLERIQNAVRINFDKDLGISLMDVDEAMARIKRLDEEESITTKFSSMDMLLDGGLHPKEIYCVAGIPGGGKTLFLGNMALNTFLDKKNVLVYTFETSEERLLMRYFSNLTNLNKKEILSSEESLRAGLNNLSLTSDVGRLIIKEYNANEVSSNDLLAHMADLEMYHDFKPDVIFVDYILIMSTNDKNLSSDNSYKYYKTVTEELRNIAKTLYVPVVTACQINREGMADKGGSKSNVTAKSVSESRGINDTVDVFWVIRQTNNDLKNKKFRILFDKNRNDKNGIQVEFEVDYEHMKVKELGTIGE